MAVCSRVSAGQRHSKRKSGITYRHRISLTAALQRKVAEESVIVVQTERQAGLRMGPEFADWEDRRYGRNVLLLWVKDGTALSGGSS